MVLKKNTSWANNSIGQIFTPNHVAKFMVKNVIEFVGHLNNKIQDLKVLEPSVGEGIFLKYFLQHGFSDVTAYEMDISLKDTLEKSYPKVNFKFENFLGSDINEKFDLIIGNPPYLGQNYNAEIFQDYVKKYPICKKYFIGNMDLFYYFIHICIEKLNFGGFLSFITTNYWITKSKKTGIKLLKPHILDECFLLQYIDLSNLKLFRGAEGQHNCIIVLQKKIEREKSQKINKNIEIIHIGKRMDSNQSDDVFNQKIFADLIQNLDSNYIKRYKSTLTNNDLKPEGSWNLLYPEEVKTIVKKVEKYCKFENKITHINDYFIIRNGLIFIKDDIFILNEGENLKVENSDFFVKINKEFIKLTEFEKKKLKKIYKSKSIKPYGYKQDEYIGYAIYFNKNEFNSWHDFKRNQLYNKNYPGLTAYLKQFEKELRDILVNAKEDPNDFYFPRRGAFIRKFEEKNNNERLVDLEPFYNKGNKIFFKYISSENIFGYTNSSYLATSDTYFLWPKLSEKEIDYLFIIAYLNSKLVHFLFKAKNISIKRSKTKLEYGLLLPNLDKFRSEKDVSIIRLIKFLSSWLIEHNHSTININLKNIKKELSNLNYFLYINQNILLTDLSSALEHNDDIFIQKFIDNLIFQLFELKEEEIDYLFNKYYKF